MPKSIHNTVMLGSLSISFPEMRKNAKEVARKAEADGHAKDGTISASKHLLAGIAAHKIAKDKVTAIRAWWANTLPPWSDGKGGWRACASLAVPDIKVQLGDMWREELALYEEFLRKYPEYREQRKFEMGEFFDPREFPSPEEMRRRLAIRVSWCALPKAEDIRIVEGMDEADVQAAMKDERDRIMRAEEYAAQKLFKVVKSMRDTMATPIGEPGAKFNNTKLENILQVAELIPKINLTGNPKLNALAKEAKKLATKSPDELREDEVKRAAAAKEAKGLADKLAGMFSSNATDDDEDE